MTLKAVLKNAMALPPRQRRILADELWRSVPHDEGELALTLPQARDLKRRIAEDAAGESNPVEWEAFRKQLGRRKRG